MKGKKRKGKAKIDPPKGFAGILKRYPKALEKIILKYWKPNKKR